MALLLCGKAASRGGNRGLQLIPSHHVCPPPVSFPTPKLGSRGLAGGGEGSVARAGEQGHGRANWLAAARHSEGAYEIRNYNYSNSNSVSSTAAMASLQQG